MQKYHNMPKNQNYLDNKVIKALKKRHTVNCRACSSHAPRTISTSTAYEHGVVFPTLPPTQKMPPTLTASDKTDKKRVFCLKSGIFSGTKQMFNENKCLTLRHKNQ